MQKALKYHKALQRRPNPGYLYDRFYNSWLDSSSLEELKAFLTEKAESSSETSDRLLLAFFHAKLGDDVEALQQFGEALKNDPGNAATLYEKAVVEARTLNFESALSDLLSASKANPSAEDSVKIAQLRGKLLVRNRQTDEAVKVWEELLKANPDDAGLLEDMVEVQIAEGLYDQAIEWSDKLIAITKDPFQKVVRQLRKGDIYQRSGKRKKALEVYGEALGKVGVDSWLEREIIGQIDQLFRREDDLTGLNEHLAGMIKQDGKRLAVHKAASKIQMELGLQDEAIASFQKIIDLTPGDRANREAFVALLVRADQTEKAVKQMESLVSQNAGDAELQIRLAELCHKVSDAPKTKAAIEQFIQLSDSNEYSLLRAARLFEKFSDKDNATATYEKAIAAFADSDSVKESWATFLFRSDKKDKAIEVWKELAKGSDRQGLVRIARIASTRKQNQAAMDMLLARFDEMKFDTIYLGQLCTEAIALKKFEQAVPWATERVRLSKTSGEIETCINPSVSIIASAEKTNGIIQQLQQKETRNASEVCLLVELLERSLLGDEADAQLAKSLEGVDPSKDKDAIQILARQKVRLLIGRQDWSAAAVAARELIDLPGGRKSVNVRQLVDLYVRSNDEASALKWVNEWKRLSPGSLIPWLNEASLLDRAGNFRESINVLRAATRKFPKEADLYAQLAQKYIDNGQVDDAERIFWRQYDECEKLADKLRWSERLASIADQRGEITKLVEKFDERRKNNPQSIGPLLAIAQTHRVADNYEERRAALLEATRLQKDNLPLLLEIARMEESEGEWEKAIGTLERASLLDKTNRANQNIARIYIEYGETSEGLARLLEIAGGASSSARDVEKIAASIVKVADWQQLRDFIAPQVIRFEKDYRIKYFLAIANEELGYTAEAERQFLELLKVNEEIPSLSLPGNSTNNYFAQQSKEMRGLIPPGAIEFMNLTYQGTRLAYAYRQDQRRGLPSFGRNSSSSSFLPDSIDSCKQYSLVHIRELAADASETRRKSLRGELIRAGVVDVDLLLSETDMDAIREPTGILESNPESESALAIATMGSVNQGSLDQDELARSYSTFKDSYPQLAFLAALQLDFEKEENQQRFEASILKVKDTEKPSSMLVMPVAQRLSQLEADQNGLVKYRDQLNQLISSWYSRMDQNQASSWMFSQVVQSLRNEESQKRFIEFLDSEIERSKDAKTQQSISPSFAYAMRYGGRGDQMQVALPQFPPTTLLSFPDQVYGQLGMSANSSTGFDPFGGDETDPMTAAQIAESIPVAKDPTFKALLQIKYFESEPTERAAEQQAMVGEKVTDAKAACDLLLATNRRNIDAWYLSASLAAFEKRWEDATDQFEKMRSLPMNAAYRRLVDGHLVAIATQGIVSELKKKENEKVVQSAKSAALRLRRGRLSPEQRLALVDVLETLELNDEAEKMESRIASSRSSGSSGLSSPRFGFGSTPSSGSRIANLADSGKSDAASRLLAQKFRTLARTELDFNGMLNNEYAIRQLNSEADETGLKKELLAQLDPGDSTNARKLSTWAVAVELLSDKKKSVELYKKLLEVHPGEDEARLRLLMLQAAEGEDTFTEHFAKVGKRNKSRFLPALLNSASFRDSRGEDLLNVAESVFSYVAENADQFKDKTLLAQLLGHSSRALTLKRNDSQYRTSSVYAKPVDEKESTEKKKSKSVLKKREMLKELAVRQRMLHDRIARKMIDTPEVAAQGFTALLASNEAAKKPVTDELVQLALKAVYPRKSTKRGSTSQPYPVQTFYSSSYYGGGSNNRQVTKRTPVEFLARHYGLDEAVHDEQVEAIATKLESLKVKDDADKLRGIYQLCKATDEQYVDVAASQIKNAKEGSRRTSEVRWQATLDNVYEIWKDREIKADISSMILDFASRKQKDNNYYGAGTVVGSFAKTLAKRESSDAVAGFLARLRESHMGTEEEQEELMELLSDPKKMARNRKKLTPVMHYVQTVQALSNTRETFFLSAKEMSRFQIPGQGGGNLEYRFSELMEQFKPDEADEYIAWLNSGNLLGSLENFDPFYQKEEGDSATVWGDVLPSLSYRINDKLKTNVLKLLEAKPERTFGESLFVAFAKDRSQNIYNLIGEHADDFESLSEDRQSDIARFANQLKLGGQSSRVVALTKSGRRISKLCNSLMSDSIGSMVEKLMKAKRFRDLEVEEYSFDEWATGILSSIDRTETEKLVSVITKMADLTKNNRQIQQMGSYDSVSMNSQLVDSALPEIDTDSLKILLDVYENENFQDFTFSSDLAERIDEFMKREFAAVKAERAKGSKEADASIITVQAMDAFQSRLGDSLGDRPMNSFIPQFQSLFTGLTKQDRESLDKLFAVEAKGKHPKIGNAIRLAWLSSRDAITMADNKADTPVVKTKRAGDLKPHQAEMVALINDESASIQSRLPIATSLATQDLALPPEGVWASCALIVKAIEKNAVLNDEEVSRLFEVILECDSDDSFKEKAGAFAKSWSQVKIRKSRSGSYWSSNEGPMVGAVRILAQTDNLPTLKKLLASDQNSNHPAMLISLIESGLNSDARPRFQKMWRDGNFFYSLRSENSVYSKNLEEKLPEFTKLFKDDGTRFFAELFFASMKNSEAAEDEVATKPKDRLASLSQRFPGIEFKSKRLRQLSLVMLAGTPAAASPIRESLKDLARDIKVEQVLDNHNHGNSDIPQKLLSAYVGVEVRFGNYEPVKTIFAKINGTGESETDDNPFEDNWRIDNFVREVSAAVETSLSEKIEVGTPEAIEPILPLLLELNKPTLRYRLSPELNAMAHLILGRTDELVAAWEAAPKADEEDEDFDNTPHMDSFLKQIKKYVDKTEMKDADDRVKLVKDVWTLGAKGKFSVGSGHYQDGVQESCSGCRKGKFGIDQLAKLKLLDDQQILEFGPTLAELNSVHGEIWRQVAKRQFAAEKYDLACESFRKALDASKEEMKQAKFNRRVEYANALVKLGRNDDAKTQLKEMQASELLGDNVAKFQELKVTLGIE